MDRNVQIGFLASLALLLLVGVTSYRSTVALQHEAASEHHSLAVAGALDKVLLVALDAETSARGYALTGSEPFLEPYQAAVESIHREMHRLRMLLRDDRGQGARLDTLESLMERRLAASQREIELRQTSGLAAVARRDATGGGKQVTDAVRAIVAAMEGREAALLREEDRTAASRARATKLIVVASSGLACLILALASALIWRAERRRRMAEQALHGAHARLTAVLRQMPVGVIIAEAASGETVFGNAAMERILHRPLRTSGRFQGYHEDKVFHADGRPVQAHEYPLSRALLGETITAQEEHILRADGTRGIVSTSAAPVRDAGGYVTGAVAVVEDLTGRKAAEMEIQQLNETLRKEASNLEAANRELEAFSYSVSHDLRAPLRHLGGFLELLEAHISGVLDEKGRHYLDTLLDSARQMGSLIDDLLHFSRTSRAEMCRTRVGMGDLVTAVQQQLAADLRGRKVVWTVPPLPEVTGDPALLRQVLVNLLGNAIKYTRTRAEAAIEIGCREDGAEWVFCVRDNGVGFDMRYAHKLFGVFQRLHESAAFEGTGIGLATVQRIIGRHGGRTWAEGVVDQGAAFYFSLPRRFSGEQGRYENVQSSSPDQGSNHHEAE